MDSVDVEQLMAWLEEEIGVTFDEDDYSVENFDTIAKIETLASMRLRRRAP